MRCRLAIALFPSILTAALSWACHAPSRGAPDPEAPVEQSGPGAAVTAFVDVHVVPMDSERILDGQTVLIRGDRIAATGPVASVAVPPGATVIDGRGKYLMPGLVDMHAHIFAPDELPLYLASGVTSVRNMKGSPMHLEIRDQIAAGALLGPTIYTSTPIIDGVPVYWPGADSIDDPSRAEALVLEHKRAGYDFVKLYMNLDKASYEAMLAAARKHGMKTAGHVPTMLGMGEVLEHPMGSLEHLWAYFLAPTAAPSLQTGAEILRVEAESWLDVSEAEMQALARALAQAGIWSCATMTVRKRAPMVENPEAGLASVEQRYASPLVKDFWLRENGYLLLTKKDYETLRLSYGKMQMMVRALRDAGARILLGSDTPNPFVLAGFSVHEELENLVGAGLTPYEAIRAGTRDAAEFLGQDSELGAVAGGMRADLLLIDANPLADVRNASKITGIMLRGQWLPAERLQRMLDDMVASFAASSPTGDRHE
jgi:imidazolonepropionase-like amidohydrolase